MTKGCNNDSSRRCQQIFDLIIIFFTVIIAAIGILSAQGNPFDKRHLLLTDSLNVPAVERERHLDILLRTVESQHGIHVQVYLANEANRMQARIFFITAFAALASVAFASKTPKIRQVVSYLAFAFTVLFYLLDVHMRDLSDRQIPIRDELRNTMIAITKVHTVDSLWYEINQTRIDSMFQSAYEHRWARKKCLVFHPNFEQIVFYFVPIFLLFLIRIILGCNWLHRKAGTG